LRTVENRRGTAAMRNAALAAVLATHTLGLVLLAAGCDPVGASSDGIPRPAAAPPPAPLSPVLPSRMIGFTLFFDIDSAAIDIEGDAALAAAAEAARQAGSAKVIVIGHADRAGRTGHNRELARRRAEAVRAALAERGVPPSRIAVAAYGEKKPRIATPDGVAETRNRRAEIVVVPAS
jgi:OOP family OmpA-OmpF porin